LLPKAGIQRFIIKMRSGPSKAALRVSDADFAKGIRVKVSS